MTTVTVVIPAYNATATLDRTLASVRNQSHRDLDIIVVDDGSTDATAAHASAHAEQDRRVRVIRQTNGGVAKARNTGIAASEADWVAPIDADDMYHPRAIEQLLAAAQNAPEPVGFAYTWSRKIDEDDRLQGDMAKPRFEGWVLEPLVFGNFLGNASASLLSRKAALEVGGYDPSLLAEGAFAEDLDLYLRLARHAPVAVAPGYHLGYRQMRGSMSRAPERMRKSLRIVLGRLRQAVPGLPEELYSLGYANSDLYAAGLCFADRRFSGVARYALTAARNYPLLTAEHLGVYGYYVTKFAIQKAIFGPRPRFQDLDPDTYFSGTFAAWYEARLRARLARAMSEGGRNSALVRT